MKVAANKIIRSKRRTIALSISPDATLVVRAPLRVPVSYIEDFIERKSHWINQKIQEMLARPKKSTKNFVDGEEFLFLGHRYQLQISDGRKIILYDKLIFPESFLTNPKEKLTTWYKLQAQELINKRVQALAAQMNVKYSSIKIGSATHRWGSCSASGNLNFTWRLIMAPIEVVDYVIVHELTHITEKNHSSRFWAKVRTFAPDYKSQHKWLKNNDHLLHI